MMNFNALAGLAKPVDVLPVFIILLIFILPVFSHCFGLHFFCVAGIAVKKRWSSFNSRLQAMPPLFIILLVY
jgi:hypothetical protein